MHTITFLDILTDKNDSDYVKATITYDDGSMEEITGKTNIINTIIDLAIQDGELYDDVIHDTTKVRISPMTRTREDHHEAHHDDDESIVEDESGLGPIVPSASSKGKKVATVGGIVIVSGLVLYTGISHYMRFIKNNEYSVKTGKPSVAVEDTYNTSATQTETQNQGYYIVNRRNDPDPDNGSKYQENLEASHAQGDMEEKIRSISYNKYMSQDEFLRNLSRLNLDLAMNINDVYNLLEGNGIHGDEYLLYLETVFPQGSIEYAAVKHFCGLRNNIVHNAFVSKDPTVARELIVKFYNVYSNFVFNGYILSPSNDFEFNQLQPAAKYMIVELAKQILGLPVEYSMTYLDGKTWGKDTLLVESDTLFDIVVKWLNGRISLNGEPMNASDFEVLTRSLYDSESTKTRSRG